MGKVWKTDIQIRFADVYGLGHVNNARLQEYYDLGKMEFYSGILGNKILPDRVVPVIVSTKTDYFSQTRLYDSGCVETQVEKIGNKSTTLIQRIIDAESGSVRSECRTVAVTFDFARQESVMLDDRWRDGLAEYMIEQ